MIWTQSYELTLTFLVRPSCVKYRVGDAVEETAIFYSLHLSNSVRTET